MIDTHTHINSYLLDDVEKEIDLINNSAYLSAVINIGLDINTSKECIKISSNNDSFYSSIGIHPSYIKDQDPSVLYNLITDKVIAIGEVGLEATSPNLEEQIKYLITQIKIANDLHLPVIIHANKTNHLIIYIFKTIIKPLYGCVFHCFEPDLEVLNYLMENNYYISFAGRITYPTAKKSIEVLKQVRNDLYLIETDSPYITPHPFRNEINHSTNINLIVKRISELKGINEEEVIKETTSNTKRLFKI